MSIKVPTSTAITVIFAVVLFAVMIGWGPSSQFQGLRSIEQWRDRTQGEFANLCRTYPDLVRVKIYAYTGGNGMVGVLIEESVSDASELVLYRWLLDSNPPRPIHLTNPKK